MTKNAAIEQLILLASAEENYDRADLDLQVAREKFVELGLAVDADYEQAWLRYTECAMMLDLSRHLKYNVDREALGDGGS